MASCVQDTIGYLQANERTIDIDLSLRTRLGLIALPTLLDDLTLGPMSASSRTMMVLTSYNRLRPPVAMRNLRIMTCAVRQDTAINCDSCRAEILLSLADIQ
jgi:hypothetical protein